MGWIPAVAGGVGTALGALGVGQQKQPDYNALIAQFRAQRPTGYITPEDEAFVGRQQDRLNTAVNRSGENARYQALNRMAQTGLLGSPASGRDLGRIQQTEAAGHEGAAGSAADTLYNLRHAREGEQWQNERDIFGARLGVAQNEQRRHDLQQSTFYNSINQFLPTITSHFGGGGYKATGTNNAADEAVGSAADAGGYF